MVSPITAAVTCDNGIGKSGTGAAAACCISMKTKKGSSMPEGIGYEAVYSTYNYTTAL